MNKVMIKGLEFDRTILLQMMGAIWQMTIEPSERAAKHVVSRVVYQGGEVMIKFTIRLMGLRRNNADYSDIDMGDPVDLVALALIGARLRCDDGNTRDEINQLSMVALQMLSRLVQVVKPAMEMDSKQLANASAEAFEKYLAEESNVVAEEVLKKMMAGGVGG